MPTAQQKNVYKDQGRSPRQHRTPRRCLAKARTVMGRLRWSPEPARHAGPLTNPENSYAGAKSSGVRGLSRYG
jgi:hypothetical protein